MRKAAQIAPGHPRSNDSLHAAVPCRTPDTAEVSTMVHNSLISRPVVVQARDPDLDRELKELRESHACLSSRLQELAGDVTAARGQMSSQLSTERSADARSARRTILFARIRALRVLRKDSMELNLNRANWCRGNAVAQLTLKSQVSDCTLREFRMLTSELCGRPDVTCTVSPSRYYAFFGTCTRYEIIFETFFDICQALQIDVVHREEALYREKCTRGRSLRAVQVLGVENITNTSVDGIPCETRTVLLGRSTCVEPHTSPIWTLVQKTKRWHGPTFEDGFILQNSTFPSLQSSCQDGTRRTETNVPSMERRKFCLVWEKINAASGGAGGHSDEVPGALRTFFPAVVVRTALLAASARAIFSTKVNGKFLKEILVSPPVGSE